MDTDAVEPVSPFPTLGWTARRSGDVGPTLARCAVPLALIVLVAATPFADFKSHPHWATAEWIPFTRFVRPFALVGNILLFLPFGAAFGWGGTTTRRIARATLWGLVCAAAVEFAQVYTHTRVVSMSDVIAGTIGAWLAAHWAVQRHRAELKHAGALPS